VATNHDGSVPKDVELHRNACNNPIAKALTEDYSARPFGMIPVFHGSSDAQQSERPILIGEKLEAPKE